MSVYSISLFLHIVGALGLFAVLGLEWAGLYHLRRATGAGQVREWVRLLAAPRAVGGPAALIILVTGIHMSATRWGPQGWIVVGLGGDGGHRGARRRGQRPPGGRDRAGASGGGRPDLDRARGGSSTTRVLALALWVRTALFLGIVFLMSTEPSAGRRARGDGGGRCGRARRRRCPPGAPAGVRRGWPGASDEAHDLRRDRRHRRQSSSSRPSPRVTR